MGLSRASDLNAGFSVSALPLSYTLLVSASTVSVSKVTSPSADFSIFYIKFYIMIPIILLFIFLVVFWSPFMVYRKFLRFLSMFRNQG